MIDNTISTADIINFILALSAIVVSATTGRAQLRLSRNAQHTVVDVELAYDIVGDDMAFVIRVRNSSHHQVHLTHAYVAHEEDSKLGTWGLAQEHPDGSTIPGPIPPMGIGTTWVTWRQLRDAGFEPAERCVAHVELATGATFLSTLETVGPPPVRSTT